MSGDELFLLVAGWVMIIEGLLPLMNPKVWQQAAEAASKLPPEVVRRFGAGVLATGLFFVWLVLW